MSTENQPPQASRRPAGRLVLLAVLVLLLAGAGYLAAVRHFFGRTQIVVRNRTAKTLSGVEVRLDYCDAGSRTERWEEFSPGEQRTIRPQRFDLRVRLDFVLAARRHVHEEGVDLWSGETYAFEIQPDGSVRSGYDYGRGIGEESVD